MFCGCRKRYGNVTVGFTCCQEQITYTLPYTYSVRTDHSANDGRHSPFNLQNDSAPQSCSAIASRKKMKLNQKRGETYENETWGTLMLGDKYILSGKRVCRTYDGTEIRPKNHGCGIGSILTNVNK